MQKFSRVLIFLRSRAIVENSPNRLCFDCQVRRKSVWFEWPVHFKITDRSRSRNEWWACIQHLEGRRSRNRYSWAYELVLFTNIKNTNINLPSLFIFIHWKCDIIENWFVVFIIWSNLSNTKFIYSQVRSHQWLTI